MKLQEFSDQFDVLYNNSMSNQAPGLDEYEKSFYLTKAQSELIKSYFDPAYNKAAEGFDGSIKRQYDFSNLIRVATLFNVNSVATNRITDLEKIDRRSQVFIFPENYFLSVNEIIQDENEQYSVKPISYMEYQEKMTKPYALPPKRQAWRLFTDKKNCNYFHEYAVDGTTQTKADYEFLTTWADQKRNLELIITQNNDTIAPPTAYPAFSNHSIKFRMDFEGADNIFELYINSGWKDGISKSIYSISISVGLDSNSGGLQTSVDDEQALTIIKEGFKQLLASNTMTDHSDWDIVKACRHLDGMTQATMPSKFNATSGSGKTFNFEVIQLPVAEIIGKFNGEVSYQLRYVRRPKPIVLTDLSSENVSIEGVDYPSECELSRELHPEILQRAVELAKAAYTGDLQNQIVVGQASATEKGVVAQSQR